MRARSAVSTRYRTAIFFLAAALALTAARQSGAQSGEPGKWRSLFDGTSMDGWKHVGPGGFLLLNGQLKTEGGLGLLFYEREKLGNCDLRVVYRLEKPGDNSGVYVRIDKKPDDPWYGVHHGYEVQIAGGPSGDPYRVTGAIYTFAKAAAFPSSPPGEWNTMVVKLRGRITTAFINGMQVSRLDPAVDPVPPRHKAGGFPDPEPGPRADFGYVGLQNHDDRVTVYFREVSVRDAAGAARALVAARFN
jgi:hypothetical protein